MPDASLSSQLTTPQISPDAAQAIAGLAQLVLGDRTLDEVLEVVVEIAKGALPGPAEVSITLVDGAPVTVASSGNLALELDERQYAVGYGPCLDSVRFGTVVTVPDMGAEQRWPKFTPRARNVGVAAALAVPLPFDDRHIGALNVYFGELGLVDEETTQTVRTISAFVAVALTNADRYEKSATLARQLGEALQSRAVIDQAKGILMARNHVSADAAFELLVHQSQNANRKLRDIAAALVEEVARRD